MHNWHCYRSLVLEREEKLNDNVPVANVRPNDVVKSSDNAVCATCGTFEGICEVVRLINLESATESGLKLISEVVKMKVGSPHESREDYDQNNDEFDDSQQVL